MVELGIEIEAVISFQKGGKCRSDALRQRARHPRVNRDDLDVPDSTEALQACIGHVKDFANIYNNIDILNSAHL